VNSAGEEVFTKKGTRGQTSSEGEGFLEPGESHEFGTAGGNEEIIVMISKGAKIQKEFSNFERRSTAEGLHSSKISRNDG